MAEASGADEQRDDWNDHWDRYAESASLNPAQTMRHELILDALRSGGARIPTARLLDVGSGQGDFLVRANQSGLANEYAGFELSASGIRIASAKVPGAKFVRVDLYNPPPEAEAFKGWATAAVCSDVIEHVDDPVAFLRALKGYLAPDARLVLTVPGGPRSAFDVHIGHRRHYTRELARDTLQSAGFDVESVNMAGFPFFNAYRLLVILRGKKLVKDVESGEMGKGGSGLAKLVMGAFDGLFPYNARDSRFGWQVVAVARPRNT
ncbi:MAG: class I SAM-dependent methyltransferase [Myxococcales bacterium]|nr:class I SAM-dependent methyltransferase [Myxococcales bacterium]